jgi:hypothetical protein
MPAAAAAIKLRGRIAIGMPGTLAAGWRRQGQQISRPISYHMHISGLGQGDFQQFGIPGGGVLRISRKLEWLTVVVRLSNDPAGADGS